MHSDDAPQHTEQLYKPHHDEPEEAPARWTFITPFVALTFMSLPSLLVLAYAKQTVAYNSLLLSGLYPLIAAMLWLFIPLAVLCALLYVIRGGSHAGKALVVILSTVLIASFGYIVWPR